jgi:hypothetical protein
MSDFDVVGEEYEYEFDDEETEYEFVGYDNVMGAAKAPRMPAFLRQAAARGGMVRVPSSMARPRPRLMAVPKKPQWRNQMAPGVIAPNEGLIPLPLTALQAGGTFAAATTQITFQGQLQKPFRPERLLVSVVRTGTSATGRLLAQLFVGTDLQQADINGFDIELFGAATAFGTRLTCKAAQPGVLIRLITTITSAPTGSDTVFASCSFAGRVIH